MSKVDNEPARLLWLDGLRGIAAVQVVFLHYASAFLPAIGLTAPGLAHYGWEMSVIHSPLFLPFDGYSAVYIFFVLSGVALTYSFGSTPFAIGPNVLRRVIRLGIPMAAAMTLAAGWFLWLPHAHTVAGTITNSTTWLSAIGPSTATPGDFLHQLLLEGMLAGYNETSSLPLVFRQILHLAPLPASFNPPLWTLHVEFVGSLFILALVALKSLSGIIGRPDKAF